MKLLFKVICLCIIVSGCEEDYNPSDACYKDIIQSVNDYGSPEDQTNYVSGDYKTKTYWWYSQGVALTWTLYDGVCDKSAYYFTPF